MKILLLVVLSKSMLSFWFLRLSWMDNCDKEAVWHVRHEKGKRSAEYENQESDLGGYRYVDVGTETV
jgi:hypothetical protein